MQQNASYLHPFCAVSRFRSTTQNNQLSTSTCYFLFSTELNIYQVSSWASYLFLLQPWKNVFALNWFSSSLPIYISPLSAKAGKTYINESCSCWPIKKKVSANCVMFETKIPHCCQVWGSCLSFLSWACFPTDTRMLKTNFSLSFHLVHL